MLNALPFTILLQVNNNNGGIMKVGSMVKTNDWRSGVIQVIENDLALIHFGGHQRESRWYHLDQLELITSHKQMVK